MRLSIALAVLFGISLVQQPLRASETPPADSLVQGFDNPPVETKPWCYWYWLSGHVTKAGITKDLEAMAKMGIGRAKIGDINRPNIERGPVDALSDEFFNMLAFAAEEGARLGVEISVFNCPGWSQIGGPWIKPEQSMRYLVSSELRVTGPAKFSEVLPKPVRSVSSTPPHPTDVMQDVAVIAFPVPRGEDETLKAANTTITTDPPVAEAFHWIDGNLATLAALPSSPKLTVDFSMEKPFTARSITLHQPSHEVEGDRMRAGCFDADCELFAEMPDGSFRSIRKFEYRRSNFGTSIGPMPRGPVAVSFDTVTAKRYRLVFDNIKLRKDAKEVTLVEIDLSGAARLDSYIEQQLGRMCPQIFPPWDFYLWPAQPEPDAPDVSISPEKILDITDKLAPDGTLTWSVPPGDWIIVRTMMKPTGTTNIPAAKEATGLEADKMSASAMESHFQAYVGRLLEKLPSDNRGGLVGFMIDSYETGSQNWTDSAREEFIKRYGYDPVPWLPVLTGRLVGSADESGRFMWDLRRLVADMISDAYGKFREIGNREGLELWLEPYGHYGFPAEFLQLGGRADGIGGEFWLSPKHGDMEVRAAVAAGQVYGKSIVSAEAFTGTPSYGFTQDPWSLKALGDLQQTMGINHFVLHVYIHQAYEKQPGMNSWFGTEFNRHNTWFNEAKGRAWMDYLRRSHFLLQQGHMVVDVAYFIGDDTPKMSGIRDPELPPGFTGGYVNGEAIRDLMEVKDGRFVLPDGMSYRLLVLPPLDTMRPELLVKIRDLVAVGGAVLGNPPSRSPSLKNYPEADQEVRKLANELWGDLDGKTRQEAQFGKGFVFRGLSVQEAMDRLGVQEDVTGLEKEGVLWTELKGPILPWIHKTTPEGEIYYISNQQDETITASPGFRVLGKQPELWDPVTGERRILPDFEEKNGATFVPLEFAPRQALFVLFREPVSKSGGKNFPSFEVIEEISAPWLVSFDPALGGPADAVRFDRLVDWREREEEGIRNYSGTAGYRTEFNLPETATGSEIYLDLGKVSSVARVKVNGKDLGAVWCAPWRVDISSAIKGGGNTLEIEVVNAWVNRLLADEALPEEERITWVASPAIRAQKPLPAGLLGPVKLMAAAD